MVEREVVGLDPDDLDAWFPRVDGIVTQHTIVPQWVFPFDPENYERFIRSFTVESSERSPRFRMNISNLEVVYPYLLARKGRLGNLAERDTSAYRDARRAALVGTTLHELDMHFSVVAQGMGGRGVGRVVPTANQADLERYQAITDGLYPDDGAGSLEMLELFGEVIRRRRMLGSLVKDGTPSLFGGMGTRNPADEVYWTYQDPEVLAMEQRLAEFWAKELFKTTTAWEFAGTRTSREVQLVINLDLPIQLVGRLDSVARERLGKGKYQVWVVDLKTGRLPEEESDFEREVQLRQMQLMVFMAERFTAKAAQANAEWIAPIQRGQGMRGASGAFVLNTTAGNSSYADRLHLASFRYFNKDTGESQMRDMSFTNDERREFLGWLTWLGQGLTKNRNELKQLLNRGVSYDLSAVDV